jgi:hypothetical protein
MNEIMMFRGNDRKITLMVEKNSESLPYDLTGCIVRMIIKKKISDSDSAAIITKTTENINEGFIIDALRGTVEFYIVPEDTLNVRVFRNYCSYPIDFEVETPEGNKYTVLRTWLTIKSN